VLSVVMMDVLLCRDVNRRVESTGTPANLLIMSTDYCDLSRGCLPVLIKSRDRTRYSFLCVKSVLDNSCITVFRSSFSV
jgi:hypothetical protein